MKLKYLLSFLLLLILQLNIANSFNNAYSNEELCVDSVYFSETVKSSPEFSKTDFNKNDIFELSYYGIESSSSVSVCVGYAELVNSWKTIKYCGDDELAKLATNLNELDVVAKNADEIKAVGGYKKWKASLNSAEEIVTVNGRTFIKKKFGRNSTEVFVDPDSDVIYYYIDGNISIPYAEFHLEGSVFRPSIEVPSNLRSQGIGKQTYRDAFERLGGESKIARMESEWGAGANLGDNFDAFKEALNSGKNYQEAAFLTPSGSFAKDLGFTKVSVDVVDVDAVKAGILNEIVIYFTR
jgi:hypothetical protein